mmetsp:Transcript_29708/g.90927  ORF Transcript_29708/g.90927 Transcript_29708/m.90927 type:complete len:229 (-) Transcript_29708:1266-1952(-)
MAPLSRLISVCKKMDWELVFESKERHKSGVGLSKILDGRVIVVDKETRRKVASHKCSNATEAQVIRDCCEHILVKEEIRRVEFEKLYARQEAKRDMRRTKSLSTRVTPPRHPGRKSVPKKLPRSFSERLPYPVSPSTSYSDDDGDDDTEPRSALPIKQATIPLSYSSSSSSSYSSSASTPLPPRHGMWDNSSCRSVSPSYVSVDITYETDDDDADVPRRNAPPIPIID